MARALKDSTTILDADGGSPLEYKLLLDQYGRIQWFEEPASADTMPPGEPVTKKWREWSGGMGETMEMGRKGYYYSQNAYHGDPFALKPRPTKTVVTLTDNTLPIERMFEKADDAGNKYLYALNASQSYKIKLSDHTLKETKSFASAGFKFASGYYVGDGKDDRQITKVGFQPDAVIVKADSDEYMAVLKTSTMGTYSKAWGGYWATGLIKSCDTDGFTVGVGNNFYVNAVGVIYYWQAWKASSASYMKVGSYTGDGNDDRSITGVGFQPDLVHVVCGANGTNEIITRPSSLAGDYSLYLGSDTISTADLIQALEADGFQVGTHADVNANGVTYHYVAFKALAGAFAVGSYTGTGADGKQITGVGFGPTYVTIKCHATGTSYRGVQRSNKIGFLSSDEAEESQYFGYYDNETANIKALIPDGFQLGPGYEVNKNTETYHYMAWRGNAVIGKPGVWESRARVPLGDDMGFATLQIVNNETDNPAGDDTWVHDPGVPAMHFEPLSNKFARVAQNRLVSLCSADDLGNLANWGAFYPVGPPDTKATDLTEWADELLVSADNGMYEFDGVAVSKQQLPLLGGLRDDENGKGTLRFASLILYPSADGYWRWQYGAHKAVGPDSIPGFVPAKECSDEPLNLKHYGSAFCGDHIYNACYDGTYYHIMHDRPDDEGNFIPDCMVTTANAMKALYVDSDRRLWFGWGNNLAFIQLSQGGEPDGDTFGEASLTTTIYLDQKILADDIDVRLRMLKVVCRNMPGSTKFQWTISASRDGGAFAAVGGGISADGVTKLYWTSSSNLTARRLRLKVIGIASATFVPSATPPEIIGIEFFGETVPDSAKIIRMVVDLESGKRSPKTVYNELKARENAGVCQVRHPVTNDVLNVIIYECDGAAIRQRGQEDPVGGMVVLMRHADTS